MNSNTNSNTDLIKLVEQTFIQVNSKIDDLLDCSVKDFVLLNNTFKQYHSHLNKLSQHTTNFFNRLLDSKSATSIQEQCNNSENNAQKIDSLLTTQLSQLNVYSSKYNYTLLCANNIKQDLSTLHLLFTNLKFDPSLNIDQNEIFQCLKKLNDCYLANEKNIKQQYSRINEAITFLEDGFINSISLYVTIIEKIQIQINYFTELHGSANEYISQLEELEDKKKSSTSEIITNLQFQDILRQKIEHIQEAHSNITKNLYSAHNAGNPLTQKELFQIRDISSLQSALLIHANQEYQTAVENILQRINTLNHVLNKYNSIWNHFCNPEKSKLLNKISKIQQDLALLNTHSFSINQFAEKYMRLIGDISKGHQHINQQLSSKLCMHNEISLLNNIVSAVEQSELKQQYNPIEQVKNEIKKFKESYTKIVDLLGELKIDNIDEKNKEAQVNQKQLKELSSNSEIITNLIKQYSKELNSNEVIGISVDSYSDFNLEQVNYYKTFEKEVKEIITLLDNLLEKVNLNKNDFEPDKLEHLKDMYTMQSERDIHESLTKDKKDHDSEQTNNDEVEFF